MINVSFFVLFPQCCDACAGWPLSHGRRGVLTHLVAPSHSASSDAYLLLDVARFGLTLNWVGAGARFRTRLSTDTAAMLAGDLQQLSATLKHLVAVVDRSVDRVPLDRIAYPCHGCQDKACRSLSPSRQQRGGSFADDAETTGGTGTTTARMAIADVSPSRTAHPDRDDNNAFDADNSIPHIDSDPEDSTDRHNHRVDNGKCPFS